MLKKLVSWAYQRLHANEYKIQSFTFYIPSPPERKLGYREKQFDKVFYHFINRGYKIISTHFVPNNNPTHSGMWIICIVQATNAEASVLDLDAYFHDQLDFGTSSNSELLEDPQIVPHDQDLNAQEEILYIGRNEK